MQSRTATAALTAMRREQLLPSQLLASCWARIEQREPTVRAWSHIAIATARQQATGQDQQLRDGSIAAIFREQPLFGIPIGVKDIVATVDMPTAWGLPLYRDLYFEADAAVVTRLKAAGAIILGKTTTTELATAAAGPTRNPHHLEHTPGGSSSGSAAAVADGMVPVAIGSQTMGSILRPAAYCGILGFKPSFGKISRQGVMPVSATLDHVGMFARCLEDIQLMFEVLVDPSATGAEPETFSPSMNRPRPPRLAWVQTPEWSLIDPLAQNRLQQIVQVLSPTAAAMTPVNLPAPTLDGWETTQTLCAYGLYQHHGGLLEKHKSACSPQLQDWLRRGQQIDASTYTAARAVQQQVQASVDTLFSDFDAILTPVTTGPAPRGLKNTGSPRFCGLWTLCGLPAITLPIGKTPDGLPLACQLVGRRNGDRQFLQIAKSIWAQIVSSTGDITIPDQSIHGLE